jgi:hypothetical protein
MAFGDLEMGGRLVVNQALSRLKKPRNSGEILRICNLMLKFERNFVDTAT